MGRAAKVRPATGGSHPAPPGPQRLRELFAASGLELTPQQVDAFWRFHQLVRDRNAAYDLTRLRAFESMVLKLYVDSALLAQQVDLPSPLLDLGTGAGFPGIPLKILRPELRLILVEARRKRVTFLHEAVEALGWDDVEIVHGRLGRTYHGTPPAGVVTRALEPMQATLERVEPWLPAGARVLFMKGPDCDEEIAVASAFHPEAWRLVQRRDYAIPRTPHARRVVVFERQATRAPSSPPSNPGARRIDSPHNPTFVQLRALRTARGIRKSGTALVGGVRHVLEVLRDHPERAVAWITAGPPAPPPEAPATLAWLQLAPSLFRDIDVTGTGPPLLQVRVPELPPWRDQATWPDGCTLFVPFQDPENVGATLRNAAAFGVSRVVLLEEAAHPFHPRSVRAAGARTLFELELQRGPTLATLQVKGAPLWALDAHGDLEDPGPFPACFGLLAGLEGPGLPAHLTVDRRWRIPMQPGHESLNAAAATAIALYVWSRIAAAGGDAGKPPPP